MILLLDDIVVIVTVDNIYIELIELMKTKLQI